MKKTKKKNKKKNKKKTKKNKKKTNIIFLFERREEIIDMDETFVNQKDKISYHTNWCGTGFQHYSVSKNIFPWNELF